MTAAPRRACANGGGGSLFFFPLPFTPFGTGLKFFTTLVSGFASTAPHRRYRELGKGYAAPIARDMSCQSMIMHGGLTRIREKAKTGWEW